MTAVASAARSPAGGIAKGGSLTTIGRMSPLPSSAPARSPAPSSVLIALLAALTALDAVAIDMFLPALPALQHDLQTSPAAVQQTLSVFLLGLALGPIVWGPLLDRYGRRRPLLAGVALYALASVGAALADGIGLLLLARWVQALGASVAMAAPRAVVADLFEERDAARVYTLLMQVFMIGPVLAPLAGVALIAQAGWRSVFWALALGGLALGLWCLRALPETLPPARRTPLAPRRIAQAYGTLLRNPRFVLHALAGGISMGSLIAYLSQGAFAMQQHFGLSELGYGVMLAGNAVGIIVAGQLNTWLLRRHAPLPVVLAALALHTAVGAALWTAVDTGLAGLPVYLAGLALAMATLGLTFGNLTALTMAEAGPQAGTASALMGLLQTAVGAAIGALAAGLDPGPQPLPVVFVACGVVSIGCCVLAASAAVCRLRRVEPNPTRSAE